jgi:hypothetical protein
MNPLARMLGQVLPGIVLGSFLLGCGKTDKTAVQGPSSPPTQELAQAQGPSGAPVVVQSQPLASPQSPKPSADPLDLNREVRKWILRNRRPPKNFEDFAATSGIEIPPPPDGKKYVLDKTMHVTTVNR